MFEVIVFKNDGSTETYDCLTEMQATYVFFQAKSEPDTSSVQINELVE
jgi:hypothetical protein